MIHTSEIKTTDPEEFVNETQRKVYAALERLEIPFVRIDNDPAPAANPILPVCHAGR